MSTATYLGLNFGTHDSSATILRLEDGKIRDIEIFSTERITKVKHGGGYPLQALRRLRETQLAAWETIHPENVAVNCNIEHPFKRERRLAMEYPPHTLLLEKFKLGKASSVTNSRMEFITHHLCHAYSTLAHAPVSEALVVVCDGLGNGNTDFSPLHPELQSWIPNGTWHGETTTVYRLRDGQFDVIDKLWSAFQPIAGSPYFQSDSLGNLFVVASGRIFGDLNQAGKVMGLAAYGQAGELGSVAEAVRDFIAMELRPIRGKAEFDQLAPAEFQQRANIAARTQAIFERELRAIILRAKDKNPHIPNLILVGGCALNCSFNGKLIAEGLFENVFVPPFPNDEGISLGAALALAHKHGALASAPPSAQDSHAYLGPRSSDTTATLEELQTAFPTFTVAAAVNLSEEVAEKLAAGEAIAWMRGRPEVGPRALGARSILLRPDAAGGKARLNAEVKKREAFRPYGATFLQNHISEWFAVPTTFSAPYMTTALPLREGRAQKISEVVHADGTCRFQTLSREQNPAYFDVIDAFRRRTGLPLLLNTSLNVMGQPILELLADAVVFMQANPIDTLVYGDYILTRRHS